MRQTKGHSRAAYRALWQQRVQAWQHSGLSKAAFARQHGYPHWQLCDWVARLQKESAGSATASPQTQPQSPLTPIHIIATTVQAPQIRITYQQCQCEFASLPDPQWLAQWLQALQA